MHKFEIKRHNFIDNQNPVSIYVNCSTSLVNPLDIEKDVDSFIEFMVEKYKIKKEDAVTLSFSEWISKKFSI